PIARETVIERATEGIVVLDGEGRMLDVNPAAAGLLGLASARLVGAPIDRVLPGGRPPDTGRPVVIERAGRSLEGHVAPLATPDRTAQGSILFIRDVTQVMRSEALRRAAEEKLRSVANASADFICELDPEGRFLYVNHTYPELTMDQVIGASVYDF